MLQFAARTKWRYGDGENEEGLPTFTTLCGRKMGLMPAEVSHDAKISSWKGFQKLQEFYRCGDREGRLWDHLPQIIKERYPEKVRMARSAEASRSGVPGTARSNPSTCLLYTSPSPRDGLLSRMPSSA